MSLNLEGFRIEIARAMYEDSIGGLEGAPGWFEQTPEARDGFIKLAAAALNKMWMKNPKDLVQFFAGHLLEITEGCGIPMENPSEDPNAGECSRHNLCNNCIVKVLTHEEK